MVQDWLAEPFPIVVSIPAFAGLPALTLPAKTGFPRGNQRSQGSDRLSLIIVSRQILQTSLGKNDFERFFGQPFRVQNIGGKKAAIGKRLSRACPVNHFRAIIDSGEFNFGKPTGINAGRTAVSAPDIQNPPGRMRRQKPVDRPFLERPQIALFQRCLRGTSPRERPILPEIFNLYKLFIHRRYGKMNRSRKNPEAGKNERIPTNLLYHEERHPHEGKDTNPFLFHFYPIFVSFADFVEVLFSRICSVVVKFRLFMVFNLQASGKGRWFGHENSSLVRL